MSFQYCHTFWSQGAAADTQVATPVGPSGEMPAMTMTIREPPKMMRSMLTRLEELPNDAADDDDSCDDWGR